MVPLSQIGANPSPGKRSGTMTHLFVERRSCGSTPSSATRVFPAGYRARTIAVVFPLVRSGTRPGRDRVERWLGPELLRTIILGMGQSIHPKVVRADGLQQSPPPRLRNRYRRPCGTRNNPLRYAYPRWSNSKRNPLADLATARPAALVGSNVPGYGLEPDRESHYWRN